MLQLGGPREHCFTLGIEAILSSSRKGRERKKLEEKRRARKKRDSIIGQEGERAEEEVLLSIFTPFL